MKWLNWFVSFEHAKPLALLILFFTFALILVYVFGNKRRGQRLESHKNMLFHDDEPDTKEDRIK